MRVKVSLYRPGGDRVHHVSEADVRVVLGRLPPALWSSLRGVHLNDRSRGARVLGYVNRGRREIALCALPPRMSLSRFLVKGQSADQFGARKGQQWPPIAIRRFMLYDVFLHELGHLQVVHERARTERRKFAMETRAQDFAMTWCDRLLHEPFDHPDPVHQAPTAAELADPEPEVTDLLRRTRCEPDNAALFERLGRLYTELGRPPDARAAFEHALELDPHNLYHHLWGGTWHYAQDDPDAAVEHFTRATVLWPDASVAHWCLAEAHELAGDLEQAHVHFHRAVEVAPTDKLARRKLTAWKERSAAGPAAEISRATLKQDGP